MIETVRSTETSVYFYGTTRRHIQRAVVFIHTAVRTGDLTYCGVTDFGMEGPRSVPGRLRNRLHTVTSGHVLQHILSNGYRELFVGAGGDALTSNTCRETVEIYVLSPYTPSRSSAWARFKFDFQVVAPS
jgi:hypothetical protein